ncbi:MAG TPA: DMT family transporter [Burkholderiaceae bacterium]|nr:DMT family transporter [Burkholderiaceae bacterium]
MNPADLARLLGLAALWGASFMLLRILAPALGPLITGDLRVLIAGAVLLAWTWARGDRVGWRANGARYLVIGLLNAAVPFTLFAFAALHLPAGYSAILNATTPLFGAICAAIWLGERFTVRKLVGMLFGLAGVGLVAQVRAADLGVPGLLSIGACVLAALSYGLGNTYARRTARHLAPMHIAGASQWLGGLALLPVALPLAPSSITVTPLVVGALLALALGCSAIAQTVYYRLLSNVGPSKALSVTFLIPLFGVLWARVFLGEPVTVAMLGGGSLILAGIAAIAFAPSAPPAQAPARANVTT